MGVGTRVIGGGRGALPSEALVDASIEAVRAGQSDLIGIVGAAVDALHAFAEAPGRKVLMLVSGGWPATLEMRTLDDGSLTFLQEGGKTVARLELQITALDARDRQAPISEIPVELAFDALPPPDSRFIYDVTVTLRRARQTLQLTLADLQGELRLAGRLEIDP